MQEGCAGMASTAFPGVQRRRCRGKWAGFQSSGHETHLLAATVTKVDEEVLLLQLRGQCGRRGRAAHATLPALLLPEHHLELRLGGQEWHKA